jgi:Tol biopolymer transport system component
MAAWRQPRTAAHPQVVRFGVDLPSPARLSPVSPVLVFSPDGGTLLISVDVEGDNQLYRLPLETGRPVPIQGARDARPPAFSPDGRWLAFVRGPDLVKVAADGGTPIALTPSAGIGVTWIDDRTIVYNRKYNEGLWRISAEGGEPELVTRPDSTAGELGHWWPQALPEGHALLYTAYGPSAAQARIEAVDVRSGKRKMLVRNAIFGRYLPDGRLAFFRDGNILAAPFDARHLEVTGDAVPLLQHVAIGRLSAAPVFAVSSDGTLAWAADSEYVTPRVLLWLDETGHERPALPERGAYSNVRLSPDGERVAFALDQGTEDVWVANLGSGIRTRITTGPGVARFPIWSPDGRRVYYQLEHGAFDINARDADAGDTAVVVARSRFDKYPGAITPDGRWLAYASSASGQWQVRVAPFGGRGSRQVTEQTMVSSPADRGWIRWADAGRQLLFTSGDSIMRLPFDPRTGAVGTPQLALRTPYHVEDVSRDGRRFLVTKPVGDAAPRRIDLVLHWLQEIDRGARR